MLSERSSKYCIIISLSMPEMKYLKPNLTQFLLEMQTRLLMKDGLAVVLASVWGGMLTSYMSMGMLSRPENLAFSYSPI